MRLIGMLLASLSMVLLLWLWQSLYRAPCLALIVPLIACAILFRGLREAAIARRRVMAQAYLQPGSPLLPWFLRRIMLTLRSLVLAVVLTSVLFLAACLWNATTWGVIAIDAVVIVALYTLLNSVFGKGGVRVEVSEMLARHWATAINVPLLLLIMFILQLNSSPPEYVFDQSLLQAVDSAAASVGSACHWVNSLVKVQMEMEAAGWWLMTRGSLEIGNGLIRWIAWGFFLFSGGMAWWGFSRLTVESIAFVHHLNRIGRETRADE